MLKDVKELFKKKTKKKEFKFKRKQRKKLSPKKSQVNLGSVEAYRDSCKKKKATLVLKHISCNFEWGVCHQARQCGQLLGEVYDEKQEK